MKILFLFILPFTYCAYGQTVTFKEIRLKSNAKYYNPPLVAIIFPIVVTKNAKVAKLINTQIKEEVFPGVDTGTPLKEILIESIAHDGLSDLSYKVTCKKNGILSFRIDKGSCAAYCTSLSSYFNFDLKTGKSITIDSLISEDKMDSFKSIVFADKVKALTKYKKEETAILNSNTIDTVTYNWAIEQVDSECIKTVSIEDFSLSDLTLEINDACEFPHMIRSQEPSYELKYSYSRMAPFLRPRFKKILVK